jgi:hypothetical protein
MTASQPELTYRMTRTVQTGGSGCAALLLHLLAIFCGLAGLFFFWPLVIAAIFFTAIGLAFGAKHSTHHFCGLCGNDVAPTSQSCPHCRADLIAEPWLKRQLRSFRLR